jgi:integrase/recombinase XerD
MSSKVYLHILNGFQCFLAEQADRESVSLEMVRQWLSDRIRVWSMHTVADRARLIDRFLDWMVNRGALADNPFADLRRKYGQRKTKPIVQALLNPAFETALEALRPPPPLRQFSWAGDA